MTEGIAGAIHVLNGPNLNRLGLREPEIYGRTTLAEVEAICREAAGEAPLVFRQTNSETQFIDWVHEAIDEGSRGMIVNPAAFTFTSMAIMDALKMYPAPLIEFHISDVHKREPICHRSLISAVATVVTAGAGARGCGHAVRLLLDLAAAREAG